MKNYFISILKLLRPYQWIKNGFVFTGILFANAWSNHQLLLFVIITAVGFSLLSSSIYILNDIIDQDEDQKHPKKKSRPIASGAISITVACVLSCICGLSAFILGIYVSWVVFIIFVIYGLLNIGYSFYLKHIVILDVFCIAAGFMLRILAGTIGVGIPPSQWLLLCGLMVTLFLGFAKRRAELIALKGRQDAEHRKVLDSYGAIVLDEIMSICATGVIITYSLYTMSPETIKTHHTNNLIYTIPFVIYALFRYLYLIHHRKSGEEPSRDLVKDPHIMVSAFGWLIVTFFMINK